MGIQQHFHSMYALNSIAEFILGSDKVSFLIILAVFLVKRGARGNRNDSAGNGNLGSIYPAFPNSLLDQSG